MWSYAPFKGHNGILNQDISKTITARSFKLGQIIENNESIIWCKLKARSFKLGQLIEDNESIIWCKLKEKSFLFLVIALCKLGHRKLDISNTVTARSFKLSQIIH